MPTTERIPCNQINDNSRSEFTIFIRRRKIDLIFSRRSNREKKPPPTSAAAETPYAREPAFILGLSARRRRRLTNWLLFLRALFPILASTLRSRAETHLITGPSHRVSQIRASLFTATATAESQLAYTVRAASVRDIISAVHVTSCKAHKTFARRPRSLSLSLPLESLAITAREFSSIFISVFNSRDHYQPSRTTIKFNARVFNSDSICTGKSNRHLVSSAPTQKPTSKKTRRTQRNAHVERQTRGITMEFSGNDPHSLSTFKFNKYSTKKTQCAPRDGGEIPNKEYRLGSDNFTWEEIEEEDDDAEAILDEDAADSRAARPDAAAPVAATPRERPTTRCFDWMFSTTAKNARKRREEKALQREAEVEQADDDDSEENNADIQVAILQSIQKEPMEVTHVRVQQPEQDDIERNNGDAEENAPKNEDSSKPESKDVQLEATVVKKERTTSLIDERIHELLDGKEAESDTSAMIGEADMLGSSTESLYVSGTDDEANQEDEDLSASATKRDVALYVYIPKSWSAVHHRHDLVVLCTYLCVCMLRNARCAAYIYMRRRRRRSSFLRREAAAAADDVSQSSWEDRLHQHAEQGDHKAAHAGYPGEQSESRLELAGSHPTFCGAAMHPQRAPAAHAALCRKDLLSKIYFYSIIKKFMFIPKFTPTPGYSTEAPRSPNTVDFASQGGNNRGSPRRHQTKTYGIEMQRRLFRAYTHIYASEGATTRRRPIIDSTKKPDKLVCRWTISAINDEKVVRKIDFHHDFASIRPIAGYENNYLSVLTRAACPRSNRETHRNTQTATEIVKKIASFSILARAPCRAIATATRFLKDVSAVRASEALFRYTYSTRAQRAAASTGFNYRSPLVEEDEIPAHKIVLSAASPVFRAMFTHDMLENNENSVKITDITEDILTEMLSPGNDISHRGQKYITESHVCYGHSERLHTRRVCINLNTDVLVLSGKRRAVESALALYITRASMDFRRAISHNAVSAAACSSREHTAEYISIEYTQYAWSARSAMTRSKINKTRLSARTTS
ncbi:unnamed protein product, partial [Trichogramma brassicae]